ncbi:MAG: peptidoglycan recognition protein family protein [Candidatus Riflebacteria bacterium]|nr:peptidoglycan recognition protein family protein [Candidatus Riflebacteria bacterium]
MKKLFSVCSIFLLVGLLIAAPAAWANEDTPDYQTTVNPGFSVVDKTYDHFETEIYEMDTAANNMLISVDAIKSKSCLFRSYARFRYAQTGIWTKYMAFDSEYHFSAVNTVSAYQLMFVVRDPMKGTTTIPRFTVQGVYIDEKTMEYAMQEPAPFEPIKVTTKPALLSRKDWGARPPKSSYSEHAVQRLVVHHSYIPNQSQYKAAASIRGIQNYHMDDPKTGWADIGYHFLIGPEGTIYQGRPETVVGAHASPNTNAVGICLIGDYDPDKDPIPPVMEKSLVSLLSWLCSNYRVNPGVNIFGHCDYSTKSCPGLEVYKRLPQYREQIIKNIGQK